MEIMVVMIIVAAGVSLVGPRLFNAYNGIRAASEELKLTEILKSVKMKSFLRQSSYAIELEDKVLQFKNSDSRVEFEFITFPPKTITFNGNGFPDISEIRYSIQGEEKRLKL